MPGSWRCGNVAVVPGVTLYRALRPGITRDRRAVLRLVHREPDVRDHERLALVGDVDDPRRSDARPVRRRGAVGVRRVLVDLDEVGLALDRHRDRELRDRDVRPDQPADLAHLRVGLARLDLRQVDDDEPVRRREVTPVAVVGDGHPVRAIGPLPDPHREPRVADVHCGRVLGPDRRRVEGLAVGRHPALVSEDRRRARSPGAPGAGSPG